MTDEQLLRYGRHILLDDIGIEGQERLLESKVLIVGAGGLGSPVALYLASAGVGEIRIADDDVVELSNLQRQIIHTNDRLGELKVESAKAAIGALNPQARVTALPTRLADQALMDEVAGADLVVDCCDNFQTRHAINRACVHAKVPLVSGAAIRFEGQVCVFDARLTDSACYHCLFPEADDVAAVNCATMGVFAPLVGIIGSIQASEAIKVLAGVGKPLTARLVLFDARASHWHEVKVPKDPHCAVCQ